MARNVSALYVLQIASYLLPLLTIPFLINMLGVGGFGALSAAASMMFLGVLMVDCGFNTVAVRELAQPGIQIQQASEIYVATQVIRLLSVLAVTVLLLTLSWINPQSWFDRSLAWASYAMVLGTWLYPTWLFQGLEVMHLTTVCSICGRVLACGLMFWMVRGPDDLWLAAFLQSSATVVSGLIAQVIIVCRLGLRWRSGINGLGTRVSKIWRQSRGLLGSEFLTHAGNNSGAFVLSFFATDAAVGAYATLEKVARAALGLLRPVLTALLPRIVRQHRQCATLGKRYATQWRRRLILAGIVTALGMASAGLWSLGYFEQLTEQVEASWILGMSGWLMLAIMAQAEGQLMCLGLGRPDHYSQGLWTGSIVHITGALVGTWLVGVGGLVSALVLAEACRYATFALKNHHTINRNLSCAS